jgi:hypothetical protein
VQQTKIAAQQTQLSVQQTQLSVQQTQLSVQQTQTQLDVGKIAEATVSLSLPSSLAQLNSFRAGTPRARLVATFVLLSIHRFFGQPLRYESRTEILCRSAPLSAPLIIT